MSLKSPVVGTAGGNLNGASTTNTAVGVKPVLATSAPPQKLIVVVGQDSSECLINSDQQSNASSGGSTSSSITNSPVPTRNTHVTSALPPISTSAKRLSGGTSNTNSPGNMNSNSSSSSINSNNNSSSSPNKPLPKPPSYLQKVKDMKDMKGNKANRSQNHLHDAIPVNNLLQKTLSEGDIGMINSQKALIAQNPVPLCSSQPQDPSLPVSPLISNQLPQLPQPPIHSRRTKSNSVSGDFTKSIDNKLPPLPPLPSVQLPPLPPIPSLSQQTTTTTTTTTTSTRASSNSFSMSPPITITEVLPTPPQPCESVSSTSLSPPFIPLSPPTLSSSTSSSSSLQILSLSTPITNSASSPNLNSLEGGPLKNGLKPNKSHNFKLKYFTQPTRCQLCSQFIWSLIGKQGFTCNDCGFAVHKLCCPKMITDHCVLIPPKRKNSIFGNNNNQDNGSFINLLPSDVSSSTSTSKNSSAENSPDNNCNLVNNSSNSSNSSSSNEDNPDHLNDHHHHQAGRLTNSHSNNQLSNSTSFNQLSSSNSTGNLSIYINGNNISPNHNNHRKSRNSIESIVKDFHNSFRALVPLDETLLASYSCGYQGSVLKHGKLYITENYLCFYDNLVFDKTKQRQKVIAFSSIKSIEKKSGLAPNGILVKTQERDYQFCLFLHRDEVFEIFEALLLYQEKLMLSSSINLKNVDGVKQVLNQQKSRRPLLTGGKTNRRSKSVDHGAGSSVTLRNSIVSYEPPLITVIKNNDTEMIQLLLEYYNSNKSDEMNQIDPEGYTPLHVAVSSDCLDSIVLHLLKNPNIKVSERNMDGNTPLHYFCQKFRSPECQKIAQLMIDKGADVNSQNNIGETPLHKAIFNHSVRLLMVYVLLKNNANVNNVNLAGESPLHYAVRLGRLDVLKILIQAGADPTLLSTKEKKTPLILAEEMNNLEIVDLLKRLEIIINSLTMSNLLQYKMALILEEISQEGSLSRLDEVMMSNIGCYDEEHKKLLYALKSKKILVTGPPAVTHGANELLKELENMDIKNGKWVISQQDLEYTDKIGSGISGKVYKGLYRGREVAIKVLKSADEAHNREEFLKEFNVLASLQSTLIVGLYGVVLEPRICLVMEYCQKGSLYQVLHNEKINWDKFFSFSFQLLKGISTLHQSQPQIVHRDVKTLNFLVTKDFRIKVADFGLSRFNTKSNQMTLNKTRGTSAYCAPEVFQGQEYSEKSDVYSLGVVFWELVYSVINQRYLHPYGEYKSLNEFQIMLNTANQNLRPTIPASCPQSIRNLVTSCWDKDIISRPTATTALITLSQCEKEYQSNQAQWNELIRVNNDDTFSSSSE